MRSDPTKILRISKIIHPIEQESDLDRLMDLIGNARYVLLGEASHGTHEYYTWRSQISKRLIKEKNFSFIGVEGDWPDSYHLNRYIKGYSNSGENAKAVLSSFDRWPTWMWANWEIVAFAEWLKDHNRTADNKVGFYGLDIYSLWESMGELLNFLEMKDPVSFEKVLNAVKCFDPYGNEGQLYALNNYRHNISCEEEVVDMLTSLRSRINTYKSDPESILDLEQNGIIAVNAEKYYRTMIGGNAASWNLRDQHMYNTLERLMDFYGENSKAIVWEHNTHIGDAGATDMKNYGMTNVGQLVKENHLSEGVIRVGFGSFRGEVIAGSEWGADLEKMKVPPARKESWEMMLYLTGKKQLLALSNELEQLEFLQQPIPHRAIGVVYNPMAEFPVNYVPSIIPQRYEAFIFLDETHAVHPLHLVPNAHLVPETYPWGV
jgi:erythromycin esterase